MAGSSGDEGDYPEMDAAFTSFYDDDGDHDQESVEYARGADVPPAADRSADAAGTSIDAVTEPSAEEDIVVDPVEWDEEELASAPVASVASVDSKVRAKAIAYRDRTEEDDVRTCQKRCTARLSEDGICLPGKRIDPLVMWSRTAPRKNKEGRPMTEESVASMLNWPSHTDTKCLHCAYGFEGTPVPLPVGYDTLRNVYVCRGTFCSWQCAKAHNATLCDGRQKTRNTYIALLAYQTWTKFKRAEEEEREEARRERGAAGDEDVLQEMMRLGSCPAEASATTWRSTPASNTSRTSLHEFPHVVQAPPRERLRDFGGDLSIEEFRANSFGVVPADDIIRAWKPYTTFRQRLAVAFSREETNLEEEGSRESSVGAADRSRGIDSSAFSGVKVKMTPVARTSVWRNALQLKLKQADSGDADGRHIIKRQKPMETANTLLSSMNIKITRKRKSEASIERSEGSEGSKGFKGSKVPSGDGSGGSSSKRR
jgi:hypothetical protein